VVFVNFRGDRGIEISRAFEEDDFPHFDRGERPDVLYAGMMEYDGDMHVLSRYLVEPPAIDRTLTEHLAASGVAQLAIAETQKYGHVTYFWNGNCAGLYDPERGAYVDVPASLVDHDTYVALVRRSDLETHVEIDSDRVPFERRPWMKAAEVTDALIDEIETGRYRFARVNYANGDMVGHSGDREAAIVAMSAVDLCLGRLLEVVDETEGALLLLADHGNADEMYMIDKRTGDFDLGEDGTPKPKTSHTLNPVSCVLYAPSLGVTLDPDVPTPGLSNIAATVLGLLGFCAPEGYDPTLLS
jgi:2,3-bisphosphoglycerate-independent phosphoglycerate mutase